MLKRAMSHGWVIGVSGLVVLASIAIPVYAHCGRCALDGKTQAGVLDTSKMTLSAAATLAEVQTKGIAVRAMCHKHGDSLVIEVHCMVDDKIVAVEVDGKTGKVGKSKEVKHLEEHVTS